MPRYIYHTLSCRFSLVLSVHSQLAALLLLLLSHFSHVRLCATPETTAHQAPFSLEFSRQEHQSGWPFPCPMHESEKWRCDRSVVSDSVTSWTAVHQAPPPMGFSRIEYWSGLPLPSPSLVLTANIKIVVFFLSSFHQSDCSLQCHQRDLKDDLYQSRTEKHGPYKT